MEPYVRPVTPDPSNSVEPAVTCTGRLLLIEDDPQLGDVVSRYLQRDGFDVELVADGLVGLERALDSLPDLVILDLMLPGLDGLSVFRRLRSVAPIPVVMLTARGDEEDRVAGLELGADDYIAKPFSPRELVARVKAVLRRAGGRLDTLTVGSRIEQDGLVIDLLGREVLLDGTPLALTAKELDLLAFLASHPGVAFRREELLERVWGWSVGDTATVTVHIQRLRQKIEEDPSRPTRLVTVRGTGYRWQA